MTREVDGRHLLSTRPPEHNTRLHDRETQFINTTTTNRGPGHYDNDTADQAIPFNIPTPKYVRVLAAQTTTMKYNHMGFDGVCVDMGAQISVCGLRQAQEFCSYVKISFSLRRITLDFKFGNTVTSSLNVMKLRFSCPNAGSIDVIIDIVNFDIPL